MKYQLPILFALGTALCWGLYGPTVANARDTEKPARWSPFKPYVFIGVAYLVIAIAGGAMGMGARGDSYTLAGDHSNAAIWGFLAGCLGAFGALSLTTAMLSFPTGERPRAELVMPIVFGGAVTITAIVGIIQSKNLTGTNPLLWVGMLLVLVGIVLVAYYTPHGGPSHAKKPEAHASAPETPAAAESAPSEST